MYISASRLLALAASLHLMLQTLSLSALDTKRQRASRNRAACTWAPRRAYSYISNNTVADKFIYPQSISNELLQASKGLGQKNKNKKNIFSLSLFFLQFQWGNKNFLFFFFWVFFNKKKKLFISMFWRVIYVENWVVDSVFFFFTFV